MTEEQKTDHLMQMLIDHGSVSLGQATRLVPVLKELITTHAQKAYLESSKFNVSQSIFDRKNYPLTFEQWKKSQGL